MSGALSINVLAMDLIIDKMILSEVIELEDKYRLFIYQSVNKLFSIVKKTATAIADRKKANNKKK
jgi:hypothetical protein